MKRVFKKLERLQPEAFLYFGEETFQFENGHTIRIFSEGYLDNAKKYSSDLVKVARSAFGNPAHDIEDILHHVFDVDRLFIAFEEDRAIGFATNKFFDLPVGKVFYFPGVAIERLNQGAGINSFLRPLALLLEPDINYIFTRTQNPAVYATMLRLGAGPKPGEDNSELLSLASQFAELLDCKDKLDGFVLRKMHTGVLNKEHMPSIGGIAGKYFKNLVKVEQGDALLIIGKYDKPLIEQRLLIAYKKYSKLGIDTNQFTGF